MPVCSKLAGGCWALYQRKIVDHQTLEMVYHSLITSHLNYCISIWGGASVSSLLPLDRMQKKAVRIITNGNAKTHTQPLFSNLQILKLNDIHKLEIAKLMHEINYKSSTFCRLKAENSTLLDERHSHDTRRKQQNNFFCTGLKKTSSKSADICCTQKNLESNSKTNQGDENV